MGDGKRQFRPALFRRRFLRRSRVIVSLRFCPGFGGVPFATPSLNETRSDKEISRRRSGSVRSVTLVGLRGWTGESGAQLVSTSSFSIGFRRIPPAVGRGR